MVNKLQSNSKSIFTGTTAPYEQRNKKNRARQKSVKVLKRVQSLCETRASDSQEEASNHNAVGRRIPNRCFRLSSLVQ